MAIIELAASSHHHPYLEQKVMWLALITRKVTDALPIYTT
jgi:hypothetical protein